MTDLDPIILNSLQTSFAVAILFALVLIVRRPFARQFGAKAAYALWLVPVARLFMPPLPAGFSIFGLIAPAQPAETAASVELAPMIVAAGSHPARAAVDIPAPPPVTNTVHVTSPAAEPGLLEAVYGALPALLLPVWIAGACLIIAVSWRKQAVFQRLIRNDSQAATDSVQAMASAIARDLKLKRTVDVRTSLLYGSPLVTGLSRPVILLPAWFEADYSPREQRDALTHELMHVKRHDLFALQAAQLVLALQWFNPLAHLAMRAFRVDQEAACDADVLRAGTSSAFSYGQTLVKAARLAGPADGAFRGANLTLTHPIKERLILMQNTAPTLRRRLLGSALALTLGSGAIIATGSCAASAAPKQDAGSNELAGAEEPRSVKKHARVYRFSSHGEDDSHQFVMLSDPFEKLKPRLDKLSEMDFSDIQDEMSSLSIELSGLSELAEFDELGELAALEGLAELGNLTFDFDLEFDGLDMKTIETEDGVKIIIPDQEIFISKLDEDEIDLKIEKIVAIAEAHAERAEAIAKVHEERAKKIEIIVERDMEKKAARMEELGEQMGARIEAAFADGLEDELEAAGDLVGDLADQCEDRSEDLSEPVILSAVGTDGQTYRALCVAGARERLQDEDVKVFVMNNATLSDAEKARFEENRSVKYEYSWTED